MSEKLSRPEPANGQGDSMNTDVALLENLHAGQEAAFEALFRRYYARVRGVLYRLVGDEAEDLAQEVFVRLYLRPPKVADVDLGAWLYRVATNLGYNALRARRRWRDYRDLLGHRTAGAGWEQPVSDPESHAVQAEEQHLVRAALAGLKERQATLLALRYGGLSYREVAEVLGVAPGSVGALLARAERAFEKSYRQLAGQRRRSGGER